jgi:gliding motility-associated lipoprotein GldD
MLFLGSFFGFSSCDGDEEMGTPKPRGYFRIELSPKTYQNFDSICPFTFDYPVYSRVVPDKNPGAQPCWLNIEFPKYNATINLSYIQLDKNIDRYVEDSRSLAVKHTIKASAIDEQMILRDSVKVYGLLYDIKGNAASSVQFYLTDSTRHFLRGALYFNVAPNVDSLGIVIDYIHKDIDKMIQTFRWKK